MLEFPTRNRMSVAQKLNSPDLETESLLKTCHLFRDASSEALEFVLQLGQRVSVPQGEPIILENELNDQVYFVLKGAIEIVSYIAEEKRIQRVALLKEGSQFAEFSVLTGKTKSGSAYAFQDCQLFSLPGQNFLELLRGFPEVTKTLVSMLAGLNFRVETAGDFIPFYSNDQLKIQKDVLGLLPIQLWKKMGSIPLSMSGGTLAVAMKDPHSEELFQYLKSSAPNLEVLAYLIPDLEFDSACEFTTKWLKSAEFGQQQPKPTKLSIVDSDAAQDLNAFLKATPLFSELPEQALAQLSSYLQPQQFKAGQVVLSKGEQVPSAFLVLEGRLRVSRPIEHSKAGVEVSHLEAGSLFGEVSVLTNSESVYTYRTLKDSVLLPIPAEIFTQLIGTPYFTLPMARHLADRMQKMGARPGLKYFRSLEHMDFREVAQLIPSSVMTQHQVLPLKILDNEIILGVVQPDFRRIFSAVGRYLLDYRLRVFGITPEQFKGFYQQFKLLKGQQHSDGIAQAGGVQVARTGQNQQTPSQALDQILLTGMANRCSDIHFEPGEEFMTVRYRIDGVLQEKSEKISKADSKEVIGRLKIISNMDIANQHTPQDGQIKTKIGETLVMARSSCLPMKYGEKFVLRVIRAQSSVVPLNMLAPDRRAIRLLQGIAKCRQGLFLVTGPTGSGKTTTLYSMLNEINRVDINVVTLEDPVEMEIPGFNQVEIDRKKGLDFGMALRSVLRQDPDVIMVGEIRDEESAKIVFEAAITGHLVFSTLHTNSSLDVSPRLHELGVPNATIAAGLLGVLTQRLLRANCKKCIEVRPMTPSERELVKEVLKHENFTPEIHQSSGCPACNNTGYFDRIPVLEIWTNTLPMKKALIQGLSIQEMMEVARADGYETLFEFGVKLALSGMTTLEEVKRVLTNV